jgi:hypothetical protein
MHPIVERILSGEVAENVKRAASRGALPIPREDLIELWILLRNDADGEVRLACKESLAEVSESEWVMVLPDHPFQPQVLEFAARVLGKNPRVLQAVLKNKNTPVTALESLAQEADGAILDLLLENQIRLIEAPSILVRMLANQGLSPSQVRRIFDLSEQFFRDHPDIPSLLELRFGLKMGSAGGELRYEEEAEEAPAAEEPEAGQEAVEPGDEEALAVLPDYAFSEEPLSAEKINNLYQQILTMSVPAKISLALKGNKEARNLLLRDSNKVVQQAVLDSPKLTDQEVEGIARMRNLPEEVFRKLARNRDWLKRYTVLKSLVGNPKVPGGVSLPLVRLLLESDLKLLMKDKNISDLIRREARRNYVMRTEHKKVSFKKH